MGPFGGLHWIESGSAPQPEGAAGAGPPEKHLLQGGLLHWHGGVPHCLPPGGAQKYNFWKSAWLAAL